MAEGIRARHSRTCRSLEANGGGRCNCDPSWEAFVYLKREDRKLRKTFPTQAAAKAWRSDALSASSRGQLRSPSTVTVRGAADELLDRDARRLDPDSLRRPVQAERDPLLRRGAAVRGSSRCSATCDSRT